MDEREPDPPSERALDRHLMEYVRDPGLWPVLVAALAVAGTLLTAVLLFAWRVRSPFSLGALFVVVLATAVALEPDLRRRRVGTGSRILLGVWGAAGLAAVLVVRLFGF
jgi:hypothetical protein